MKPTRHKTPKRQLKLRNGVVDPVEVYCRLRTLEDQTDDVCVKALDNCTVKLMQRDGNTLTKNGLTKEIHYTFKYVFDENVSQKTLFDNIALPLVEDLIHGKNGLLFTYGITSSGKTYTMTGTPQDGGLLPRCLDTVFNSVGEYLTRKYIFKPDKLNGFDVQSIAESLVDLQKDLGLITPKTPKTKKKDCDLDWSQRIPGDDKILDVDSDNGYAVFVSYIEIYNNYIYDLLEDIPIDPIKPKPPQSKILREDANHNMYVFGMTEKEVKTADEAFELFCKGQRRRRVAHTALNTESSRSHSVFNVRLVQAPLDPVGAEIIQDRNQTIVSQLSLVDLAGSERTVRTRNTGDRLREAGNINTSLMALRECIEILRENQNQNSCKLVPYRKSKLTHLFKNYFEGEGKVRMVVCINPRVDDYDEIIHVMRFAELAQEVLLARPTPLSNVLSSGLKSGRGNNYREAVKKAEEEGTNLDDYLATTVYTMGPAFPIIENMNSETLTNLLNFMNDRKIRRESLLKDLNNKQSEFRRQLSENEKEMMTLRQQVRVLQMDLEAREQQVKCLEKKISDMKEANDVLSKKIGENERNKRALENELDEKEMLLNKGQMEKEKIKSELHDRLEIERSRMQRIMASRLAEKQAELEAKMCMSKEKFKQLREILYSGDWEEHLENLHTPIYTSSSSEPRIYQVCSDGANNKKSNAIGHLTPSNSDTKLDNQSTPLSNRAVANPRHRRSSSQGDTWLDHRPIGNLDLGTVFQPKMKKKKSVTKINVKDITKDVSKYALVHQEQDNQGEVETHLYKGDVLPSVTGGAQVIFNDVETLRQISPTNGPYNLRKRNNSTEVDIESRCFVGIEGKPPALSKKPRY
ncbi:kinesin-like protein KIF23 [Centruroides vittatus]|uniref:kinesin-like protein KIF23 n=1 Tax=Centruroides vittatus TaxID=120091 RepID=UPI00350F072C